MDLERTRRRQSLKVIISEAIMVIAVILMVTILAFIVSGYWVGSDFKIERQGLLQVASVPTGANVEIDGSSSWLQRTNTSKVLSSGEHTIILTKDGYDSWQKTITITEGLLYRLNYPRLFLNNRQSEEVLNTVGVTAASVSQNRELMLLLNGTTEWTLANLNGDAVEYKKLDVSKVFSTVSLADDATVGLFTGEIVSMDWDKDNSHILFKVVSGTGTEWVLVDVRNVSNSINLTKSFGYDFDTVKIINNSSSALLATQNGNLHKIDLTNKSLSSVLAEKVISFSQYDNEVAFFASETEVGDAETDNKPYFIGLLNLSDSRVDKLTTISTPGQVAYSRFYDNKYITIFTDDEALLYKKDESSDPISFELKFTPDTIKIGHNGEFIALSSGNKIATIDMESLKLSEWQAEGNSRFGWLDGFMIYSVTDGELIVYDYDGLNRRVLSSNVSARFPVTITSNKWLYYFSDNNLIREWLIPR
ncbi:PEGA domain-containing protein [Candidatus Saccharibacteria bacterium]|nr:PEGA domain-containing protein [Candidatus Saccharibacteria bacterium]